MSLPFRLKPALMQKGRFRVRACRNIFRALDSHPTGLLALGAEEGEVMTSGVLPKCKHTCSAQYAESGWDPELEACCALR